MAGGRNVSERRTYADCALSTCRKGLLTYMATIPNLCVQGALEKVTAGLSWKEQEERCIYLLPTAAQWMSTTLPGEASNWNLEITPIEQLAEFFVHFCAGRELMFERQVRPIHHISNGIWELKTADVRLFGWFPIKDHFICSDADTAWRIKEYNLYGGYRDQAVHRRAELDLNDPKFIPGDDPNDVISAFSFPSS